MHMCAVRTWALHHVSMPKCTEVLTCDWLIRYLRYKLLEVSAECTCTKMATRCQKSPFRRSHAEAASTMWSGADEEPPAPSAAAGKQPQHKAVGSLDRANDGGTSTDCLPSSWALMKSAKAAPDDDGGCQLCAGCRPRTQPRSDRPLAATLLLLCGIVSAIPTSHKRTESPYIQSHIHIHIIQIFSDLFAMK